MRISASEWVYAMRRWLIASNVPQVQWLAVISTNLTGAALAWVNNQELQIQLNNRAPFQSWVEFCDTLVADFEPTTLAEDARQKLRTIKQQGSMHEYVTQFNKIIFRIPNITPEEKLHSFLYGLKAELRAHVVANAQDSYEDAIRLAQRLEAVQKLANVGHNHSKTNRGGSSYRGGNFRGQGSHNRGRFSNRGKQTNRGRHSGNKGGNTMQQQCQICQKFGHLAKDCYHCYSSSSSQHHGRGRNSGFRGRGRQQGRQGGRANSFTNPSTGDTTNQEHQNTPPTTAPQHEN